MTFVGLAKLADYILPMLRPIGAFPGS